MISMEDIWQGDKLGRQRDAETVYRFVMSQVEARRQRGGKASYVLNINAGWGHGKSFFLNRLATQLTLQGHTVAQVNAWENDLANEPMIAVMSAIEDALKPHLSTGSEVRSKWTALKKASGPLAVALVKGVATSFVKKHAGDILEVASDRISTEQRKASEAESSPMGEGLAAVFDKLGDDVAARMIEAHKQHLNSIVTFRDNLAAIAATIPTSENPDAKIFVLVDELDRCRPSHAINLLEAVKHLFNTNGVIFIVATNTSQLAASIKAVYGNEFNANEYLLRFFDRTYSLREVNIEDFVNWLFEVHSIPLKPYFVGEINPVFLTACYCETVNLSLRDIEQCFEMFATIHHLWAESVAIQLPLMWPLIMAHHKGNSQAFQLLSEGKLALEKGGYELTSFFLNPKLLSDQITRYSDRGQAIRERVSTFDLTISYMTGLSNPLHSLDDGNSPSESVRLSRSYFRQEIQTRFPSGYRSEPAPQSLLRGYADYVRLATQFET